MANECTLDDRLVIGARWTSRLFSSTSISFRPADQSPTCRKLDKMTAAFAYGIRAAESPTKPQFASAVWLFRVHSTSIHSPALWSGCS